MEKKFLDVSPGPHGPGDQIAIFVKKIHFLGRKWHFYEEFILYKNEQ